MSWVQRAEDWANGVLLGEIPSGKYARLAVERFVRDLERIGSEGFPYYLDVDEAERWLEFLAELKHVKGPKAGERFEPSGYQCFIVLNLYGWRELLPDGSIVRRFREAYVEVARKNGKSFFVAGLGLGHLCIDGEFGAEIYCGATSEKQAYEVFRPARDMLLACPELVDRYGVNVHPRSRTLWILENGNRFEPIIGNPGDGASPSFGIVDEFHEHKNSNLIGALQTGMGARAQPLLMIITTAGSDFGGPCKERRNDIVRILEGTVEDDHVFGMIFTIDEGDAWQDEAVLAKANPNLEESVSLRYLLGELAKAKRLPSAQVDYRTKHLNQWVGAKAAWMNMLKLQACGKRGLELDAFRGRRCLVGLDLASRVDLASMALLFPEGETVTAFVKRWLPGAQLDGNDRYRAWREVGLVNVTEGDEIDFGAIEDELEQVGRDFELAAIGYDPFQATQFAQRATQKGLPMVEVGQTVKNLSEPMKELEAVIYGRRFVYDAGDECLVWQFGNVVARRDLKDNVFPNKERPESKIDDIVAILIAFNRLIAEKPRGFWPSEGVIRL